jgi:DNA-binding response OmpR family regulator
MITGLLKQEQELESFKHGANLFHEKPINFNLLISQIDSLVKLNSNKHSIKLKDLYIDPNKQSISKNNINIELTDKEFLVLHILASNKGNVLTREDILNKTYSGIKENELNSVDTLISRMRKKLGSYKGVPVIETVYGRGFRLNKKYFN